MLNAFALLLCIFSSVLALSERPVLSQSYIQTRRVQFYGFTSRPATIDLLRPHGALWHFTHSPPLPNSESFILLRTRADIASIGLASTYRSTPTKLYLFTNDEELLKEVLARISEYLILAELNEPRSLYHVQYEQMGDFIYPTSAKRLPNGHQMSLHSALLQSAIPLSADHSFMGDEFAEAVELRRAFDSIDYLYAHSPY